MNDNQNNWDEHLYTILFSYKIAFKVGTSHTPFQLVYELHLLLPIEYMYHPSQGIMIQNLLKF